MLKLNHSLLTKKNLCAMFLKLVSSKSYKWPQKWSYLASTRIQPHQQISGYRPMEEKEKRLTGRFLRL